MLIGRRRGGAKVMFGAMIPGLRRGLAKLLHG